MAHHTNSRFGRRRSGLLSAAGAPARFLALAGTLALVVAAAGPGCGPKISVGPQMPNGRGSTEVRLERGRSDTAKKGVQLLGAGDNRGAVAAFRQAVKDDPRDDASWFNLGVALEKVGEFAEARDAYRRAYELDDKSKFSDAVVRAQRRLLETTRRNDLIAGNRVARNPRPVPAPGGNVGRNDRGNPLDLRVDDEDLRVRPVPTRKPPVEDNPVAEGKVFGQALPDAGPPARTNPSRPPDLRIDQPTPAEPKPAEPRPVEPRQPDPPLAKVDPRPADPIPTPEAVKPEPPKPEPVTPAPARTKARVLVLQAAAPASAKPDELSAAAGRAAETVEWHLLQNGGLLLVAQAGLSEDQAAGLRTLELSADAGRIAKAGREADADLVVLVGAAVSPRADLPNRLDGEVKCRVIRCRDGAELDVSSRKASETGDSRDATARQVVSRAAEDLAKALPPVINAGWKS